MPVVISQGGRRLGAALGGVALIALALALVAGPAGAAPPPPKPKPRIVKVADDFFAPTNITIVKNKLVRWVWSNENTDSHDVTLKKGPRGVSKKAFTSETGAIGIRFEKRFTVTGAYDFYCTLHPTVMKMKITVKNP